MSRVKKAKPAVDIALSHLSHTPVCRLHYKSYLYVNMMVMMRCGQNITMTSAVQTNEQLFMQSRATHTDSKWVCVTGGRAMLKSGDSVCVSGVCQNMTQVSGRGCEAWGEAQVRRKGKNTVATAQSQWFSLLCTRSGGQSSGPSLRSECLLTFIAFLMDTLCKKRQVDNITHHKTSLFSSFEI